MPWYQLLIPTKSPASIFNHTQFRLLQGFERTNTYNYGLGFQRTALYHWRAIIMKPTFSVWVPPQKATIGNLMSGNAKSCQGTKGAGIKGRGTKSRSPWGILGGLLIWFLHSQLCNERFGRSNASGLQQVSGSQAKPTSRAALVQMELELQDGPILKWNFSRSS